MKEASVWPELFLKPVISKLPVGLYFGKFTTMKLVNPFSYLFKLIKSDIHSYQLKKTKILNTREAQGIIEQIRSFDFKNGVYEVLLGLVSRLLLKQLWHGVHFESGNVITRGVVCAYRPVNLKDISYPPELFAKQNIANKPGESVFYAGFSEKLVLKELKVKPGDLVALSDWKLTKTIMAISTGYKNVTQKKISSRKKLPVLNKIIDYRLDVESANIVFDFMTGQFAQEITNANKHLYKLTNAFAEILMKNENISGLLYPTFTDVTDADCIVIKKRFVDEGGLKLAHVQWIRIVSVKKGSVTYERLDFSNKLDENENIKWTGVLD